MRISRRTALSWIILGAALYTALAVGAVTQRRAPVLPAEPPSDITAQTNRERIKSLEDWRRELTEAKLRERISIIETTVAISNQNNTLLWTLVGGVILNFVSSVILAYLNTNRDRRREKEKD